MSRRLLYTMIVVILAVFVATVAWFFLSCNENESHVGRFPDTRSTDLNTDLKLMWMTKNQRSTDEAVEAAERVFATVNLNGLSREEVVGLLGDPHSASDSRYNFPFYSACNRDFVYRFDTGLSGCQYNIKFNHDGRVRYVKYMIIP